MNLSVSPRLKMSRADVIDQTQETNTNYLPVVTGKKRKESEREGIPKYVWLAYHQLEAQDHGVGDFSSDGHHLSHAPTTFDATVLGVFTTRRAANRCAQEHWIEIGGDDESEEEEDEENEDESEESAEEFDFVGEGKFKDAMDSGDVNTFSERVFVEKQKLRI
eukprot:gene9461-11131_t